MSEGLKEEAFNEFEIRFHYVKVGIDIETDSELGGGHEGFVEDVELLNLDFVKEYKEGGIVNQWNDMWIDGMLVRVTMELLL